MPTYALNKLVRNLAAHTMQADGATVTHHTLDTNAFVAALHEKLREELPSSLPRKAQQAMPMNWPMS